MEWIIISALTVGLIWLAIYTIRTFKSFLNYATESSKAIQALHKSSLQCKLQQAIDSEDYELAAKIRDLMKKQWVQ